MKTSFEAAVAATVTLAEPVADVVTVSLTDTVWLPAVFRVTPFVNVWTPLSPERNW